MPRVTNLKPRVPMMQLGTRAPSAKTNRTRGSKWVAIRARILRRDCGLCAQCKRAGRLTLAVEVDHITPLHLGGTDADSNLEATCIPCHRIKSADEANDRATGEWARPAQAI